MSYLQPRAAGIPLQFFVLTYTHRKVVKQLLHTVRMSDMNMINPALRGSSTVGQFSRRPSLFDVHAADSNHALFAVEVYRLKWLIKKVEKFVPSCWWFRSLQLLLRMAQTSLMVLVERQHVQRSLASIVALIGVCIHREVAPFRRPSASASVVARQAHHR